MLRNGKILLSVVMYVNGSLLRFVVKERHCFKYTEWKKTCVFPGFGIYLGNFYSYEKLNAILNGIILDYET